MTLKILLAIAVLVLLALSLQRFAFSFSAQSPKDYAGTTPAFDPRTTLGGEMMSEGIIYGPDGRVASRFTARMVGTWTETGGTLAEEFTYADGETQNREWHIVDTGPNSFTATASDIVGEARGEVSGATLQMRYRLKLAESAGGHTLDVTDWLYLAPDGTILNKSEMRKFGIKVAELVATIRPAG
ncbi:DUF3833 domain-containing protein [Tropicimonas sp. IMCC34043]|uniref:DUF3833 domain-containing protein n=1 Tax=Tropicimonas sp. IMCC34043 TaxID=2248760 RepID=UPI000E22E82C|nr:DUF3833 domain-containing protein [Tropicimonas sp. IMCC34043]